MSDRVTAKDIENVTSSIAETAKVLDLMPEGSKVLYSPGSVAMGYAPVVSVFDPETNRDRQAGFLPEFTYKTTRTEAYKLLRATLRALDGVRYSMSL